MRGLVISVGMELFTVPRGVGRGPSGFLVLMLHEMEGPDYLVAWL